MQRKQGSRRATSSPIHAFGLFWKKDEVNWFPGKAKKGAFRLLGRQGKTLARCEWQILGGNAASTFFTGNFGPYYAGLTRRQTLGKRLSDHLKNRHAGEWDRFSWFGFNQVLKKRDKGGLHLLKTKMPRRKSIDPNTSIKEMEAPLIKSMALKNRADSRFVAAEEWRQVRLIEVDALLAKLR